MKLDFSKYSNGTGYTTVRVTASQFLCVNVAGSWGADGPVFVPLGSIMRDIRTHYVILFGNPAKQSVNSGQPRCRSQPSMIDT